MLGRLLPGACVLACFLGIGRCGIAQVIYSDGLTHTIPGDPDFTNGESITLESASSLIIDAGADAQGTGVSGNQAATGGAAVAGTAGTSVIQNSGSATGGQSSVAADSQTVTPMQSTGGAGMSISGSYTGSGGQLIGGYAFADGAFGVSVQSDFVTATGGAGLALSSGASANLQGVSLTGGESLAWTADILVLGVGGAGLSLNDSGPVTISSGTFTGGNGQANNFSLTSGDATGRGGAAVDVRGSSNLTINGGNFEGGAGDGIVTFLTTTATGIGGAALKITGPAHVTVNGGSFGSGAAGGGAVPPVDPITTAEGAITVVGDSESGNLRLVVVDGLFRGLHALQTLGTSPNATDPRIDIYGGDLDTGNAYDISLANPNITTRIHGSSFVLNGNPISLGAIIELNGTLAGILADDTPFEWTFERSNSAPLLLAAVPEPGVCLLVGSLLPLLTVRRRVLRRSRQLAQVGESTYDLPGSLKVRTDPALIRRNMAS